MDNITSQDNNLYQPQNFRKLAVLHILAPYLMTKLNSSYDEAYGMIRKWLAKCNKLRELDLNQNQKIKVALNRANHSFPLVLKTQIGHEKLYHLLKEKGVLN
jgi:hypothetical protein